MAPALPQDETPRRGLPIAILSFNRPDYLGEVLASLAQQLGPQDQCYLFQDGGWNPHSRIQKTPETTIAECAAIFQRMIPSGRAFVASVNLGIAGNYRRAEEYLFSALQVPEALFLEDDLVLSPHYLGVTTDLLDLAGKIPELGYVSAYGDFWADLATQQAHEGELQPMHENWGSAMTRQSWLKQRPIREMYWSLVRHCDYRQRDHEKIRAFYRELGVEMRITSQDASRWIACAEYGLLRMTPRTCHARYIGEVGEHAGGGYYQKYRFGDAVWYPRRPSLDVPSPEQIMSWRETEKQKIIEGYVHSYQRAMQPEIGTLASEDLFAEAKAARDGKDFNRARAAFMLGMIKFPDSRDQHREPKFRKELLRMLGARRAWEEIREMLEGLDDWADHPWHEVILGRAYAAAGNAAAANEWWGRVRARAPNHPEALDWFRRQGEQARGG